ncbi:Ada metal-binding domain-containing protein [Reinekea marina]|uniref:DNA-3-methyladenine glycosylase 2 family protein n=1 Tax=Reinekea marina TaxID=1310421 RepID=A0ABV7WQW3_9GAMM|nr:Ada metal-binding domain-containing protein [Reinekea marina]MDN3647827.1 Ada metal-binding domain-containing protein [Reinekea marina]
MLTPNQCEAARKSRDVRYDGSFVVAVKSTGIFCRPICPANLPKEENVEYFQHSSQALQARYRPCLRCRPESAPGSWAWKGVETTFQRALQLIEEGALSEGSLVALAERLGISDRYLRKLFQQYLGLSPKAYSQYQQLMLAKQLLHGSQLSIQDIAFSSGFSSVRRFNDAFKQHLQLTPSDIRRKKTGNNIICLDLPVRGSLNFSHLLAFYKRRDMAGIEFVDETSYQRSFNIQGASGVYRLSQHDTHPRLIKFEVSIDHFAGLQKLISHVRRQFDLDADTDAIEQHLQQFGLPIQKGIRIPGIGNPFEAGVRAILGQQVSVKAAISNLNAVTEKYRIKLNMVHPNFAQTPYLFPTPDVLAQADFSFLKMPESRKATLLRFSEYVAEHGVDQIDDWLSIKGIGPWTVGYVKLRGINNPDCFLETDLVIKNSIAKLECIPTAKQLSPWGSYATFQLWQQQSD